jgi:gliding motility-associated-like protein
MQKVLKILIGTLLFCSGIIPPAKAQAPPLCTGSLGDPVVNITFGAGSNPGPPLKAAATGYSYVTTSCPQDGSYTVTNSTYNCFSNSWHSVPSDHTGNPGGYFMLINASYTPSDFYVDTVHNLCGSTGYEFAAWVMNMMQPSPNCPNNGIRPNITFNIETTTGDTLGSYSTGDINVTSFAIWNQYGLYFSTPPNVSDIVLRMTNHAPGGCGNDLALDDITFRPCGPMVSAGIVDAGGGVLTTLCQDDLALLHFNANVSAGYAAPSYQWQISLDSGTTWTDIPGQNGVAYTRQPTPAPGLYEYRLTVGAGTNIVLTNCRISSNVLKVLVNAKPATAFTVKNQSPLCSNDSITITDGTTLAFGKITETDVYWDYLRDPTIKTTDVSGATGQSYFHLYPPFGTPATEDFQVLYVCYSGPGCLNETSQTITLVASPQVKFDTVAAVCEEVPPFTITQAQEISGFAGSGFYSGKGITAEGLFDPRAAAPGADTISYTFNATNGCSATAGQTVTVHPQPKADTGPDTYVLEGGFVTLGNSAAATAGLSFTWTPDSAIDNVHSPDPKVSPHENSTYQLKVVSAFGCSDSATVHVTVLKVPVVPNAFSPNGDGINDVWVIRYLNQYPSADVRVFNRYGQPVFHSSGIYTPWDGRFKGQPLPVATYYYVINAGNGRPLMSGSVTILR